MIATLTGKITESNPLQVTLDVAGVGYEVHVPITTSEKLPLGKANVHLFIHAVYREDSQALYGFTTREDRDLFRLLVEKVSGIGPKIAITIFSKFPTELLKQAIANSDITTLAKCPGIGKKTAERLTIELKDKVFPKEINHTTPSQATTNTLHQQAEIDATSALIALGVGPKEAERSIQRAKKSLTTDQINTESLIKLALG